MPGKGTLERKSIKKKLKRKTRDENIREVLQDGSPDMEALRRKELLNCPPEMLADPVKLAEYLADEGRVVFVESPPFEQLSGDAFVKAVELCHAVYGYLVEEGGASTVTHLRTSHRVHELMKEPCFRGQRFINMILRHPAVFNVDSHYNDAMTLNHIKVALSPTALQFLPQLEMYQQVKAAAEEASKHLPPLIDNPQHPCEHLQALRIECLHTLHKHNGCAAMNDLCAVPRVVERKKRALPYKKTMRDFLAQFEKNFVLEKTDEHGGYTVFLVSYDVSDTSMLELFLASAEQQARQTSKAQGKGAPRFEWGPAHNPLTQEQIYAMMWHSQGTQGSIPQVAADMKGQGKGKAQASQVSMMQQQGQGSDVSAQIKRLQSSINDRITLIQGKGNSQGSGNGYHPYQQANARQPQMAPRVTVDGMGGGERETEIPADAWDLW